MLVFKAKKRLNNRHESSFRCKFFCALMAAISVAAAAPLAKAGRKLPVISLSQDKSSGTSIQMITELGKTSSVLSRPSDLELPPCQLPVEFSAREAASIPSASLWAHFSLGFGGYWLVSTPLFESSSFLPFFFFLWELRLLLIPQKSLWLFRQHLQSKGIPCSFLSEGDAAFCIITFLQLLHVLCCS